MGKEERLARKELRTYNQYKKAKEAGNAEKAGKKYEKLVDRQTDSIRAGVNVNYAKGGSVMKAKMLRNPKGSRRSL